MELYDEIKMEDYYFICQKCGEIINEIDIWQTKDLLQFLFQYELKENQLYLNNRLLNTLHKIISISAKCNHCKENNICYLKFSFGQLVDIMYQDEFSPLEMLGGLNNENQTED